MNDAFSIVYAEQGSPMLRELIALRSVAALPFAGRYRIIDLLLSNLANSGIHNVGLITQRNYKSLMDQIGSGKPWDMSKKNGGIMVLPPYDLDASPGQYHSVCDALFAKRDFINHQRRSYCLVLETNAVYTQDYSVMFDRMQETGADIAILCSRNERLMADGTSKATFVQADDDGVVKDVSYEPFNPSGYVESLGAVLIRKDLLGRLVEDACAQGHYNFSTDVLEPAARRYKVVAVMHEGYAARVTSVKAYFDLNHDMLDPGVRRSLFFSENPVYTKTLDAPPIKFKRGCQVSNSLFGNGCIVRGRVADSVIFRGVTIDEDADVENCIIMQNTHVGRGAHLRNMIIDKDATIAPKARCVALPESPLIVRKGAVVEGENS
ncbi:glucose-1-phosphate adenylyltransferase subunit GlgD [Curtanaerobium respiraculi]|uniref:glucose-1-phosphate adenylyltransferase subunit GlgD n=1 Tax=Curtanaerobium respiraculi TaxID=2949669 RepID=UPI0024B3B032|nr:glucose-1-phosphate adenylyltransferase subunit GlgD [Curtanaerobium respiraculi]